MNSPFTNKLRSNKNYKISSISNYKKNTNIDLDELVNKKYNNNNNKSNNQKTNEEANYFENFCNNFEFEEEETPQPIHNSTLLTNTSSTTTTTNESSKSSQNKVDSVSEMMNNLIINDTSLNDEKWYLTTTQKGKPKVYSMGYTYTVDKEKADKIYWRCEQYSSCSCSGRAISNGYNPPLTVTQEHKTHKPAPERKEALITKEQIKEKAILSNDPPRSIMRDTLMTLDDDTISSLPRKDAIRQLINRTRNVKAGHGYNAKSLSQLEINHQLQFTHKNKKFYYEDTGKEDPSRVIIFTTQSNLKLMSQHSIWYCDGTFDISPTIFKQVYSIHIMINGSTFPMLYALLPDKKQTTYKKLFRLINQHVMNGPIAINCDYELAAINAIHSIWKKCDIHGCFFHLSQSFFKRVKSRGLFKKFYDKNFNKCFKKLQSLAFLPPEDVELGFKILKAESPKSFNEILSYVDNCYIGKIKANKRLRARFPIEVWNVNERVKKGLPRTNNNVESWHSRIKPDARKKLTVNKVIELFRLEQSNMEVDLVRVLNGETIKKKLSKKEIEREEKIKFLINDYHIDNIENFMNGISNILSDKFN